MRVKCGGNFCVEISGTISGTPKLREYWNFNEDTSLSEAGRQGVKDCANASPLRRRSLLQSGGMKAIGVTSSLLTVEVRIQALAAHLRDLLDLAVRHVLQQPPQVRPGVHRLQLFLVEVQHLVDPSLVLELRISEKNVRFTDLSIDRSKIVVSSCAQVTGRILCRSFRCLWVSVDRQSLPLGVHLAFEDSAESHCIFQCISIHQHERLKLELLKIRAIESL